MHFNNTLARLTGALVLGLLALGSAVSRAADYTIDTSHSSANFKVRHLMVSNVRGSVSDISGKFTIDDKDDSKMTAEATLGAATINTNDPKRDEHLKSPDFFDAAAHPKFTFKSKKVTKAGKGLKMVGDFTMRGITKELTLNVTELTKPSKDMAGGNRRGFTAEGSLNRKDFGINWNKTLDAGGVAVGDKVDLTIELELIQEKAAEAKKS